MIQSKLQMKEKAFIFHCQSSKEDFIILGKCHNMKTYTLKIQRSNLNKDNIHINRSLISEVYLFLLCPASNHRIQHFCQLFNTVTIGITKTTARSLIQPNCIPHPSLSQQTPINPFP